MSQRRSTYTSWKEVPSANMPARRAAIWLLLISLQQDKHNDNRELITWRRRAYYHNMRYAQRTFEQLQQNEPGALR